MMAEATQPEEESSNNKCRYSLLLKSSIDFICPVCKDLLYNPQQATCCKEHICEPCIQLIKEEKGPCPVCRNKKFPVKVNSRFRKKLSSQEVVCPNVTKGCEWTGYLNNLESHLDSVSGSCDYVVVSCPLDCGMMLERYQLTRHAADKCINRSRKLNLRKVVTEMWVPCSNMCGQFVDKGYLQDHLTSDCPLRIVSCPCSILGCQTKEITHKDLRDHINASTEDHIHLITEYTEQLQAREKKVEEEGKRLERMAEVLLHKEIVSEEKDINKQFLLKRRVEELEILLEAKNNEIADLCNKVAELKTAQITASDRYVKHVPFFNVGMYRFTMTDVNNYIRPVGGKLCWQSDPFYTHENGYKMQFMVDIVLNSLRLSLYILPGEYDKGLPWPMKGTIALVLLNQLTNDKHYEYKFVYNQTTPRSVAGRVEKGSSRSDKNVSISQKLSLASLPHSRTLNTLYLHKNQLEFAISHIDLEL